jgi:hypothetical protein
VFFAPKQRCSSTEPLVKTWPELENCAPKRHISTIANPAEVRQFKPARGLTIDDPALMGDGIPMLSHGKQPLCLRLDL